MNAIAIKDINLLKDICGKVRDSQGEGVLKAYRRLMVVIFSISICSKAILLIIVLMSRHSVMSLNALDMFCVESFLAHGARWRGRNGTHG